MHILERLAYRVRVTASGRVAVASRSVVLGRFGRSMPSGSALRGERRAIKSVFAGETSGNGVGPESHRG